jgi:hypothetical protein
MMMKFWAGIVLAVWGCLSAQAAVTVEQCEKEARTFGDGSGPARIEPECRQLWMKAVALSANRLSADGKLTAIAHRNLIFLIPTDPRLHPVRVLAGEYTQLDDVVAVAFNRPAEELAVLEASGDVAIYSTRITGNVAPLRVLRAPETEGATDVAVDVARKEVVVYNPRRRGIYQFPLSANIHGREPLKAIKPTKRAEGLAEQGRLTQDADSGRWLLN